MYIVTTKLDKPRPPWLLVAMSHICKYQNKKIVTLWFEKVENITI